MTEKSSLISKLNASQPALQTQPSTKDLISQNAEHTESRPAKFRQCFKDFDPKFLMPCRQTVTFSMIPTNLEARKNTLFQHLERCNYVSLTSDAWSDRRCHAYIGVTVHSFVNGEPKSHLLAFHTFAGSHIGQRIAEELQSIIGEFSLQEKVRFIVADNASNVKKALCIVFYELASNKDNSNVVNETMDDPTLWEDIADINDSILLTDVNRLPCFMHSLQLVVRDALMVWSHNFNSTTELN